MQSQPALAPAPEVAMQAAPTGAADSVAAEKLCAYAGASIAIACS